MLVKEGLFYFVLFTLVMLIRARPQGDSMVKASEKPEPVSNNFIFLHYKFNIKTS